MSKSILRDIWMFRKLQYDLESNFSCLPPATILYYFFIVFNVLLLESIHIKGKTALSISVKNQVTCSVSHWAKSLVPS